MPPDCGVPEQVQLGIRPEDINIDPEGQFSGQVAITEPLGVETVVHIRSKEQTLISLLPGLVDYRKGDEVKFNIQSDRLHCFDLDGIRVQME
jgi:ABC-type sugar transport system ATPase subunit